VVPPLMCSRVSDKTSRWAG